MASHTFELSILDTARRMLSQLHDLDEIQEIRETAKAMRQSAKSADLGLRAQNQAAEVILRAERRAGEVLAALALRGGSRKSASKKNSVSLNDFGISGQTPNGFGEYWRPAHETVLLGVRGKLPFRDGNLPSYVDGQRESLSRESSRIRHLLESASPGPYLDIFGTEPAAGWTLATSEDAGDGGETE